MADACVKFLKIQLDLESLSELEVSLHLVPISLREASDFVENFHRHNKAPQGGKFAIGASDGDQLIGVVIVGRPVARFLDDGFTAEVLRCCVHEDNRNACSFYMQQHGDQQRRKVTQRSSHTHFKKKVDHR